MCNTVFCIIFVEVTLIGDTSTLLHSELELSLQLRASVVFSCEKAGSPFGGC